MKFVIQHHSSPVEHYDLMIEQESSLLTWQISLADMKQVQQGLPVRVKKIQDHRKKYLRYEGPVSYDRGKVKIFDSGEYSVLFWTNTGFKLTMLGSIFKGLLSIKHIDNDNYILRLKINKDQL